MELRAQKSRAARLECRWTRNGREPPHPSPLPIGWGELEFGHSDSLNPKGCQRVAGGRRSFMARRPPGRGLGEVNHPGWGDRAFEPARSGRTGRRRLWHPSRVLAQPTRLSGGRSGTRRNDHRLSSGNPSGWLPFQSTECPNFSDAVTKLRLGRKAPVRRRCAGCRIGDGAGREHPFGDSGGSV